MQIDVTKKGNRNGNRNQDVYDNYIRDYEINKVPTEPISPNEIKLENKKNSEPLENYNPDN